MTPSIGFSFYRLEHGRVNISAMVIWHEIWHVHVSLEEYLIHSRTLSILENKLNDNKILLSLPLPLSLFYIRLFHFLKKSSEKSAFVEKRKIFPCRVWTRYKRYRICTYIYISPPPKQKRNRCSKTKSFEIRVPRFPLFSFSRKYARTREKARVKKKKGRETNNLRSVRVELDSDHYIRSLAIRWRVDSGG